jgi:hypothetical protein
MAEKNPTREIFFFKNDTRPIVYILLSLIMGKSEFYEMFPAAIEITEADSDLLILEQNFEVVYVGDSAIIDTYFNKKETYKRKSKK